MKKFEDDPNTRTDDILALAEAFFPYFCISVGLVGTLAAILVPNLSFELRLLALTTANSPTILGASITEHHNSRAQYNIPSRKPPTIKNISALNYSDSDSDECEDSSDGSQSNQNNYEDDRF